MVLIVGVVFRRVVFCSWLRFFFTFEAFGGSGQKLVGGKATWYHTSGYHVKDADQGKNDGDSGINREVCVEKEQCNEYDKESFAVEGAQEGEVLEHGLEPQLGHHEQSSHWEQVERQDVEEWVRGSFWVAKVGEPGYGSCNECQYAEEVECIENIDDASLVDLLLVGLFFSFWRLTFHYFKIDLFKLKKDRNRLLKSVDSSVSRDWLVIINCNECLSDKQNTKQYSWLQKRFAFFALGFLYDLGRMRAAMAALR